MGDLHNQKPPHIIIIPAPFQGHINPTLQLSLKLASRGFIITFINTQSTHQDITKSKKCPNDDIFAGARESGLDIRYETISDGFPLSFDRARNRAQFFEGRIHIFPAYVDEFVGQLMVQSDPPPDCLVSDTFSSWGAFIARKYELVFVSFWTQPALVFNLFYHVDLLKQNGHYGSNDDRNVKTIDYIPGVPTIEHDDLPSYLQEIDTSTTMHRVLDKAFKEVKLADFIIFNTVQELEPEHISILNQIHPTYAIGPLFPAQFSQHSVKMNLWSESDCSQWLDSKPKGSVLYASFGSFANSNKEDISEIANGLMKSGVNFIWVLRPDVASTDVSDCLPEGFLENVGDRGLVLPWCNQNTVLSHYAVGGFLTHCGWNSILESIWCGIPMICYPLIADQMTNRKLVVDDWKIGVNLHEGKIVSSGEVDENVRCLMNEETSSDLKMAVEEMKRKIEGALSSTGSSHRNFNHFVEHVKGKIQNTRSGKKPEKHDENLGYEFSNGGTKNDFTWRKK